MKAQQQSDTDSHIAISGEVTVNLQSIPVYSHQILETGIKGRIIKDTLHEVDKPERIRKIPRPNIS